MSFTLIFQLVLCLSIGGSPVPAVETRTHNAANELQGIATHDANGNMTLMPGLKGKCDAWNRLVEVKDSSDNVIATYEYNGLNQRIKKTVGSVLTKSFYNENWQEVESVTGSQMTSYVWGLRYIDDLVLREKGEERLYSLADANWNVAALVDASGAVVERMKYDAFGKVTWLDAAFGVKAASDYGWNRTFTGQVLDVETGLMLYRMRYYHTGLGRFVNRDPVEYQGNDINIYRYVLNAIASFVDAIGLQVVPTNKPNGPKNIKDFFNLPFMGGELKPVTKPALGGRWTNKLVPVTDACGNIIGHEKITIWVQATGNPPIKIPPRFPLGLGDRELYPGHSPTVEIGMEIKR